MVGFLLSSTNLFAVELSTSSTTKPKQVKKRTANVYKVQRDFTLEQQVSVRTKKIGAQLQTITKKKLDGSFTFSSGAIGQLHEDGKSYVLAKVDNNNSQMIAIGIKMLEGKEVKEEKEEK